MHPRYSSWGLHWSRCRGVFRCFGDSNGKECWLLPLMFWREDSDVQVHSVKWILRLCTQGNFLTWILHCRCRFNIESSFLEQDVTCFARHPSPIAQEGYVIMASNKWNRVVSAQHLSSVMAVTALCQTKLLPGSKSGLTDTSNIYSFDGALSWEINGNFNVCSSQENGANIWLGALGKVEQYLKGTSKLTGTVEKVCGSWVHVSELLLASLARFATKQQHH